jgi:Tfp pilus assembly protein PilV
VLLTALVLGVGLTVLAALPSYIKKSRLIARQQKTIATLERSVTELKHPPAKTQL